MEVDSETLSWLETQLNRTEYGEVGIIFHLRKGRIEWTEKIHRFTEKSVDKSVHDEIDSK